MSFNAAALKLLADKGLSAHDIAEVAAAAEMRSSGAARQARYRARKRGGDVTSNVTALRNPAPNERDNLTPTREKPKANALVKKRQQIPDDWEPAEFALGSESRKVVDSWPPGEKPAQVEQFKAHHRSKRNTFIDPQDAWSTWVLNTRKWGIGRNERSSNPTGDALARVQAAIRGGSAFR